MNINSLTRLKLSALLKKRGAKPVHILKIFKALHAQWLDISGLPGIPTKVIKALQNCPVTSLKIVGRRESQDGTIKYLLELADGLKIESVLITQGTANERYCACLSSQVGCAMGCAFCATAALKSRRDLTTGEIVEQFRIMRDEVKKLPGNKDSEHRNSTVINSIVFMGMGEPLDNLDNVIDAIDILTDNHGYNFASSKITVSTCGIVPKMKELGRRTKVNLALSLHATEDSIRTRLMPINRRYNLKKVLAACKRFPERAKKSVMIEYLLLKDVNDSDEAARSLARLLDFPCIVNLISYNGAGRGFFRPEDSRIKAFERILVSEGIRAFIRQSKGKDIKAACGMHARIGKLPEPTFRPEFIKKMNKIFKQKSIKIGTVENLRERYEK